MSSFYFRLEFVEQNIHKQYSFKYSSEMSMTCHLLKFPVIQSILIHLSIIFQSHTQKQYTEQMNHNGMLKENIHVLRNLSWSEL